ncbi:MAG: C1 family peptidase [Candidatus Wallbacteria bacterium]|nr:C1 family peptidase [Candidatus Wallbacteria bacterium]
MKLHLFMNLIMISVMISAEERCSINAGDSTARKSEIYENAVKIAEKHQGSFQVSPAAIPESWSNKRIPIRSYLAGMIEEVRQQVRLRNSSPNRENPDQGFNTFFCDQTRLPAEIDWRKENKVTPVKSQGTCGSCWAFASTACFESAIACKTGKLIDLSEQDLINCNYEGMGCDGGFYTAVDLFRKEGGVLESDEPYQAANGTCRKNPRNYKITTWRWYYKDTQAVYIAGPEADQISQTETDLKTLIKMSIVQSGSCGIAVKADDSFMAYSGGIYDVVATEPTDHGVIAVGYSDSGKYWIIKNSWDTTWGEEGFGRIAYGAAGIEDIGCMLVYQSDSSS